MWQHMQFGSFPVVWPEVLDLFCRLVTPSEQALRSAGLMVGLRILAAIWIPAFAGSRVPIAALLFCANSAAVIRYADSMRGYGVGLATTFLFFAASDFMIARRTRSSIVVMGLAALISVHAPSHNVVA